MELLLDKNKSIDIAIKIAKELNQKNLFIPVLDGFEVKENLRNGFVASNSHGIIENMFLRTALLMISILKLRILFIKQRTMEINGVLF